MHFWFWIVLCMMNEPLLNFACLSAFKLIKVCAKMLFFVFFAKQEPPGTNFVLPSAKFLASRRCVLGAANFSSLHNFRKIVFLDLLTVQFR